MEPLLTIPELADYLKVSQITLARWRSTGRGPAFTKVEGLIRYKESDVIQYVRNSNDDTAAATADTKEDS